MYDELDTLKLRVAELERLIRLFIGSKSPFMKDMIEYYGKSPYALYKPCEYCGKREDVTKKSASWRMHKKCSIRYAREVKADNKWHEKHGQRGGYAIMADNRVHENY